MNLRIPGTDPRPDVVRRLVHEGYDLLEMHTVGASLEDIFLQLTRDEPTVPEYAEIDVLEEEQVDLEENVD